MDKDTNKIGGSIEEEDEETAEDQDNVDDRNTGSRYDSKHSSIQRTRQKRDKVPQDLGEAMDAHIVIRHFRSMYTQTDFKWKKMALRWGHGKVMWASFLTETELDAQSECGWEATESELLAGFKSKFPKIYQKLDPETLQKVEHILIAIHRAQGQIDLTSRVSDMSAELQGALEAIRVESLISEKAFSSRRPSRNRKGSPSINPSRIGSESKSLSSANPSKIMNTLDETERARLEAIVQAKMIKMKRISYCTATEKCLDTSDLVFDPYDLNIKGRF